MTKEWRYKRWAEIISQRQEMADDGKRDYTDILNNMIGAMAWMLVGEEEKVEDLRAELNAANTRIVELEAGVEKQEEYRETVYTIEGE